jgi:hypothetical protein
VKMPSSQSAATLRGSFQKFIVAPHFGVRRLAAVVQDHTLAGT